MLLLLQMTLFFRPCFLREGRKNKFLGNTAENDDWAKDQTICSGIYPFQYRRLKTNRKSICQKTLEVQRFQGFSFFRIGINPQFVEYLWHEASVAYGLCGGYPSGNKPHIFLGGENVLFPIFIEKILDESTIQSFNE